MRDAVMMMALGSVLLAFQPAKAVDERLPQPVNVPEVLRTFDGVRVDSVESWEKVRRPELVKAFEERVYGRPPVGRPRHLVFERAEPDRTMMDGKAVRKRIRITYGGPYGTNSFVVTAFIPVAKSRPAPSYLLICNRDPAENIDPERVKKSEFWPAEEIVARGYAAIAFYNGDIAPDWNTGNTKGVFACFEKEKPYRDPKLWGTIAAWAWGASRVMDWIETEPELDAGHIAVIGHSRGGKTALLAAAMDSRFAMAASNDSGNSGARLNHVYLEGSQTIAEIIRTFPYWFCYEYVLEANRDLENDIDQHELVALIAPRFVAIASATDDYRAGPIGEYWSAKLASPVWELYGRRGLVAPEGRPAPEHPCSDGCISYHIRTGKHNLTPYDWARYMDFTDKKGWTK